MERRHQRRQNERRQDADHLSRRPDPAEGGIGAARLFAEAIRVFGQDLRDKFGELVRVPGGFGHDQDRKPHEEPFAPGRKLFRRVPEINPDPLRNLGNPNGRPFGGKIGVISHSNPLRRWAWSLDRPGSPSP